MKSHHLSDGGPSLCWPIITSNKCQSSLLFFTFLYGRQSLVGFQKWIKSLFLNGPERGSMAWNGHQDQTMPLPVIWVTAVSWVQSLARCRLPLYLAWLINFAAFLYSFTALALDYLRRSACEVSLQLAQTHSYGHRWEGLSLIIALSRLLMTTLLRFYRQHTLLFPQHMSHASRPATLKQVWCVVFFCFFFSHRADSHIMMCHYCGIYCCLQGVNT